MSWYEDEETVKKEMAEIIAAMDNDVKNVQIKVFY